MGLFNTTNIIVIDSETKNELKRFEQFIVQNRLMKIENIYIRLEYLLIAVLSFVVGALISKGMIWFFPSLPIDPAFIAIGIGTIGMLFAKIRFPEYTEIWTKDSILKAICKDGAK